MVYKSGQIFLPFCHNARVWRTDGQTDGRTDGQTEFSSLDSVCIACSEVKIVFTIYTTSNFNVLFNIDQSHSQRNKYNSPRTKHTKRSKKAAKHAASTSPTTTLRCWIQNSTDTVRRTRVNVGQYLLEYDSTRWNTRSETVV